MVVERWKQALARMMEAATSRIRDKESRASGLGRSGVSSRAIKTGMFNRFNTDNIFFR